MKTAIFLKINKIALCLFVFFLIIACSSNDEPSSEPEGEIFISAKIGDIDWEANNYRTTFIVIPGEGQRFDLEAFDDEMHKIKLGLSEFGPDDGSLSEQTYTDPSNTFLMFYYGIGNDSWVSEHHSTRDFDSDPEVTITVTSSTSESVSGTFQGTFYKVGDLSGQNTPEVVEITNGVFNNVPYEIITLQDEQALKLE